MNFYLKACLFFTFIVSLIQSCSPSQVDSSRDALLAWLPFTNLLECLKAFFYQEVNNSPCFITHLANIYRTLNSFKALLRSTFTVNPVRNRVGYYLCDNRAEKKCDLIVERLNGYQGMKLVIAITSRYFSSKNTVIGYYIQQNVPESECRFDRLQKDNHVFPKIPFVMPFNGRFLGTFDICGMSFVAFSKAKSSKDLPTYKQVRDNLKVLGIDYERLCSYEDFVILANQCNSMLTITTFPYMPIPINHPIRSLLHDLFTVNFIYNYFATKKHKIEFLKLLKENAMIKVFPNSLDKDSLLKIESKEIIIKRIPKRDTLVAPGDLLYSIHPFKRQEQGFNWECTGHQFFASSWYFVFWSTSCRPPFKYSREEKMDIESPLYMAYVVNLGETPLQNEIIKKMLTLYSKQKLHVNTCDGFSNHYKFLGEVAVALSYNDQLKQHKAFDNLIKMLQ